MKELTIPTQRRAGRWVGVLDPILTDAVGVPMATKLWGADWVTASPEAFVHAARHSEECVWIVDEYRVFSKDYDATTCLEWMAFAAGNFGHLCYFMAQRLMMIPPNVRGQCSNAIVFEQAPEELKDLSRQFNCPEILNASQLPRFQAILKEEYQPPVVIVTPAPKKRA